jgi:L-threonylcarbamoyladenylate synthase
MTVELQTRTLKADDAAIAEAARCLKSGGLVAFPTETVYGLGADATNGEAIARLYAAKGRPAFNPLIAHVGNVAAARKLADFDAAASRLAEAFWPGPLTLVLRKRADCPVAELATAGLDSIAIRVPDHLVAQEILHAFGHPIVAPSANRSGHVSSTTAAHVLSDLDGRIDLVIDGGATPVVAAAVGRNRAGGDREGAGPAACRNRGGRAGHRRHPAGARNACLALRAQDQVAARRG